MLSTINFSINLILLVAAIEFIFYPLYDNAADVAFTRIGAVYPDAVKIVVRHPEPYNQKESQVQIQWRPVTFDGHWQLGPIAYLKPERDWVDTVRLEGLWPSTMYECTSCLSKVGLLVDPASCR